VQKHDRYQELCALAMAGEASGHEQRELKAHLDICSECRQEYREFVQLVLPQLSLAMDSAPIVESTPSERSTIRARFLAHAELAGIEFSEGTFSARTSGAQPMPVALTAHAVQSRKPFWYGAAIAACLLLSLGGAGYLELRQGNGGQAVSVATLEASAAPRRADTAPMTGVSPTINDLHDDAGKKELQAQLNAALDKLSKDRELLSTTNAEKARLASDLKEQASRLSVLEADNKNSKSANAELRAQLNQAASRASIEEADYVADEVRLRELTDQLAAKNTEVERDRQLMSVKGQNLMATRNLHIVDVFDSDSRGRVKGAFGRIFIVDEKQLIFYAYDLNETRLQDTKYAYRVWGQKEGSGHTIQALGAFTSDDKSQRRWIFTCDDPKILSQIDSLFVTVGPASPQPRGEKLMYAYLRGPVNHP
jgi:hypothetical protein